MWRYTKGRLCEWQANGGMHYTPRALASGSLLSGWTVQLTDQSGGPGRSCAMVVNLTPLLWELPMERD